MIVHFSTVHKANDVRIFAKQCRALSDYGYNVTLIVADSEIQNDTNIKVVSLNYRAKNRLARMIISSMKMYRKCVNENKMIYHFHDPELIFVGLLLKLHGKKVIYDVHEDVPKDILDKDWIPSLFRKFISKTFKWFENWSSRRFDHIITATPAIGERFEKLGCNVTVVNNYPIMDELFLGGTDWNKKEPAVCFVGGMTHIRGIKECVQAIESTNLRLKLAGKYSPPNLKDELSVMPGWKQVDDLGQIGREEVSEVLLSSVAGLVLFHPIANHLDAQPNKMFEYMSAGIPVIASDFPLWKQFIEGNRCGVCVNPLSTDDIKRALEWIVSHPEDAQKMGQNGRDAIVKKYNWEKESQRLLQVYKELLPLCVESQG